MKNLLIFDMDGTLIDSDKTIVRCLEKSSSIFGYKINKLRENIGVKKLDDILMINAIPEDRIKEIMKKYKECYEKEFSVDTVPMPGAVETLEKLSSDNDLGVLTLKSEPITRLVLEYFFKGINFRYVVGGDNPIADKVEGLNIIISESGYPLSNIFYIGDRSTDMKAAKECGIRGIWAQFGLGVRDEFGFSFDYRTAKTFRDIPSLL